LVKAKVVALKCLLLIPIGPIYHSEDVDDVVPHVDCKHQRQPNEAGKAYKDTWVGLESSGEKPGEKQERLVVVHQVCLNEAEEPGERVSDEKSIFVPKGFLGRVSSLLAPMPYSRGGC